MNGLKKKSWAVYIILLHLFCLVVLLKSNFVAKVGRTIGLSQQPEISSYYKQTVSFHKKMDGSIPEGATIFIGDSITEALATSAVAEVSVNYGIGSDTTYGVLRRLPLYSSLARAKCIVIAVGVNDLTRRGDNDIIKNYQQILNSIASDKSVVVSAVLPVDERVKQIQLKVELNNKRITQLNNKLENLCGTYRNVIFVNPGQELQSSDSNLKTRYHVGDGIHLSTAGYRIWIDKLRNVLDSD